MRIDHYIHFDKCPCDNDKLLHEILENVLLTLKKLSTMSGTLQDIQNANAALIADVQAEDTVIGSAVTLIQGFGAQITALQAQLATAIAANDPVAIQAVADSLTATATDIATQTTALSNAVAANTPAAPASAK